MNDKQFILSMLTYERKESENGSDFIALILALMNTFLFGENKDGDYKGANPVQAVFKFLRSFGNAEVKALREEYVADLLARGATNENGILLTEAECKDKAKKDVAREKQMRDVAILQRLAPSAKERGLEPIVLTYKMERRLASLLKSAVRFDGHVSQPMLNEAFEKIAIAIASNEGSSITVEQLGLSLTAPIPAKEQLAKATAKTASAV